jgi:hypothetical protein
MLTTPGSDDLVAGWDSMLRRIAVAEHEQNAAVRSAPVGVQCRPGPRKGKATTHP